MYKRAPWMTKWLLSARAIVNGFFYFGGRRICPVCESSSRRFRRSGAARRKDARCPHCGALERHRLFWLFLQQRTDIFHKKNPKILHVAPERCFESRFRGLFGIDNYLTADLKGSRAMVRMDITDIHYPDESFDVVFCSHVLEHVVDDKRAMREFYRILKNDGWAILLVPITCNETFEDPSIVRPRERRKAFGQSDHVRRYGPDFVDRLREAGFRVEVATVKELANSDEAVKMGLTHASGEIFYCTKWSSTCIAVENAHV